MKGFALSGRNIKSYVRWLTFFIVDESSRAGTVYILIRKPLFEVYVDPLIKQLSQENVKAYPFVFSTVPSPRPHKIHFPGEISEKLPSVICLLFLWSFGSTRCEQSVRHRKRRHDPKLIWIYLFREQTSNSKAFSSSLYFSISLHAISRMDQSRSCFSQCWWLIPGIST